MEQQREKKNKKTPRKKCAVKLSCELKHLMYISE